jgi:hypothetical protein
MWDGLANYGLRGSNTEQVLCRGFADMTGHEGICMKDKKEPLFDTSAIDSRAVVNQLAAANARSQVTFFFTWTCNQRESLGCKAITEYVESEEAIENSGFTNLHERTLVRHALRSSAAILTLRS